MRLTAGLESNQTEDTSVDVSMWELNIQDGKTGCQQHYSNPVEMPECRPIFWCTEAVDMHTEVGGA